MMLTAQGPTRIFSVAMLTFRTNTTTTTTTKHLAER